MRRILNMNLILLVGLFATFTFTSCEKENISQDDVENYVDRSIFELQSKANCGKFGCYEFIFPISIQFEDGSTVEVEDYASLKDVLKTYREENPDAERPSLVFPLSVTTEEGEIVVVENKEEMMELRQACRKSFFKRHGHKGHRFRAMFCFKPVFPLTIVFPSGEEEEVAGPREMRILLHAWKRANRDAEERPEIQFPVDVTLEDGTVMTVESKDALKDLKDSCGGE